MGWLVPTIDCWGSALRSIDHIISPSVDEKIQRREREDHAIFSPHLALCRLRSNSASLLLKPLLLVLVTCPGPHGLTHFNDEHALGKHQDVGDRPSAVSSSESYVAQRKPISLEAASPPLEQGLNRHPLVAPMIVTVAGRPTLAWREKGRKKESKTGRDGGKWKKGRGEMAHEMHLAPADAGDAGDGTKRPLLACVTYLLRTYFSSRAIDSNTVSHIVIL